MRLDHINIKAPEPLLEQVRAFYCAVFGLQQGFRPDFSSAGYWLYAQEQPIVHLSLGGEKPGGARPAYLDHVAFRARGLHAFLARLEEHGVDYRSTEIPDLGLTQLFFTDPAGTGLEVNFAGEALP
jgi:catechol 2,3-dioxygenase-like lactoylglutathione lyase family enzyme